MPNKSPKRGAIPRRSHISLTCARKRTTQSEESVNFKSMRGAEGPAVSGSQVVGSYTQPPPRRQKGYAGRCSAHARPGEPTGEGSDSRPPTDRQDKAMSTHPSIVSQLAREHHRQMLAAASRRHLRRGQRRRPTGTANGAGTIIRRAAMAIAAAGLAAVGGSATGHDVAAGDGEASGRPREQRQSPGGRRASRGPAYVGSGRERDAR